MLRDVPNFEKWLSFGGKNLEMAQPKQRQQPSEQSLVGSAPLLPLLPEQQYVKNKGKPRRRVCKESTEEKHPTRHKLNHAKPRDKEILEEEEIFNLLEAFRKYFPEPPSNLRAQEIIEVGICIPWLLNNSQEKE